MKFGLGKFQTSTIEQISTVDPYENSSKKNMLFFAMQKALEQLSDVERELLLLRMNNYSYDEIAINAQH